MKIAILAFSALPRDVGGAQIFTFNLILQLLKRSHEVHLYLPRKYIGDLADFSRQNPKGFRAIPILFLENGFVRYFPFTLYIVLLFRQILNRYTIWQIIGAYPAGYVAKGLKSRVPLVLRSYGSDIQKELTLQYGLRLDPFLEKRIKQTIPCMSHLVALTPTVKECYLELGAQAARITEISNAIDLTRFQHILDKSEIRRDLGVGENKIFILSTGRYHLKKGYEYVPEAARILSEKGFDIHWLIVGKSVPILKNAIGKSGMEKVVYLQEEIGVETQNSVAEMISMPPRPLIDLYKSADLYVMPSLLETFGMVLIEAMASGIPIVTTDAPGCRDVVDQEVNGLKARSGDSASLAGCIERILGNEGLREKLIANASMAANGYDWKIVVEKYEKLYLELERK